MEYLIDFFIWKKSSLLRDYQSDDELWIEEQCVRFSLFMHNNNNLNSYGIIKTLIFTRILEQYDFHNSIIKIEKQKHTFNP